MPDDRAVITVRREGASLERDPFVAGMTLTRIISGCIELTGAYLMWRAGRVDGAMRVNAYLGLVGPLVLVTVTAIGIAGLAGRGLPASKLILILMGVYLIIFGTR
ncbi:MAG: YqhV family protein [Dactylosporangium sp.]|nr:YqhV family protein [Dactylosporangium sp.]